MGYVTGGLGKSDMEALMSYVDVICNASNNNDFGSVLEESVKLNKSLAKYIEAGKSVFCDTSEDWGNELRVWSIVSSLCEVAEYTYNKGFFSVGDVSYIKGVMQCFWKSFTDDDGKFCFGDEDWEDLADEVKSLLAALVNKYFVAIYFEDLIDYVNEVGNKYHSTVINDESVPALCGDGVWRLIENTNWGHAAIGKYNGGQEQEFFEILDKINVSIVKDEVDASSDEMHQRLSTIANAVRVELSYGTRRWHGLNGEVYGMFLYFKYVVNAMSTLKKQEKVDVDIFHSMLDIARSMMACIEDLCKNEILDLESSFHNCEPLICGFIRLLLHNGTIIKYIEDNSKEIAERIKDWKNERIAIGSCVDSIEHHYSNLKKLDFLYISSVSMKSICSFKVSKLEDLFIAAGREG